MATTRTHHIYKDDANQRQQYVNTSTSTSTSRINHTSDDDYGYVSRFRPIERDAIGARAIQVQNIPDGVLGRPVSFESMLDMLCYVSP